MKAKRITTLILAALLLTSCLFPLTKCKKQTTEPENPFDVGVTAPSGTNENDSNDNGHSGVTIDRFFGASDYDASAAHGVKKLYSDQAGVATLYNDLLIERGPQFIYTYDINTPLKRRYLCFDPTCEHFKESCTSCLEQFTYYVDPDDPDSDMAYYPLEMVIDSYDHTNAPVIYMSFRRPDVYAVNGVEYGREGVYCIERFDMNTGKRTIVADHLDVFIETMCTYGDYVYFTTVDAEDVRSICRIHKSGGEIEKLGEEMSSCELLDVVEDQLYYLADGRYLRRCDLSFTVSEEMIDLDVLKGSDGQSSIGFWHAVGGYFYYFSDMIRYEDLSISPTGNLYRVPLTDLTASPEKLAENVCVADAIFTDDTLFYLPATYYSGETEEAPNFTNINNGTILALDLKTLEVTTVCENTGLKIFLQGAINCENDRISFTARNGEGEWRKMANDGNNRLIGSKSGGVEIWYRSRRFEYEN